MYSVAGTLAINGVNFRAVVHSTREVKLWNEFVARCHYLGYKTLLGTQMRYAVRDRNGWPTAMLGFSTAAWKLALRDNLVGWTPEMHEKNLPLVVDNPRFLIVPWIEIPNLGSHILAIARRRLPGNWTERYRTTPVLIEAFVETPRYTGALDKASGWTRVGTTQGRGRYDRHTKRAQPKKDIWLRHSERIGNAPSIGRITPSGAAWGKHANKRITISSSHGARTLAFGIHPLGRTCIALRWVESACVTVTLTVTRTSDAIRCWKNPKILRNNSTL